jgi:ParB/RepB/Spo0J family partition protein
MPETRDIPLTEIDEPQLPARVAMDDRKLADLMESMKSVGQVHAIAVTVKDTRYEIIAGHRRFVAASQLGWATIRAEVFQPSEIAEAAAMLAENVTREDLSAAEEALLFQEHRERYSLDEAGLVARFKKSPDYIGDRLRLLRGDKTVFDALLAGRINFSVARELNKCDEEGHRRYLLDIAVRTGYSAAVMADHVRQWRQNQPMYSTLPPPPVEGEPPPPPQEFRQECAFCGGWRDPWNMESVMVHKDELDALRKQMQQAAQP